MWRFLFALLIFPFLLACERPMPNPEIMDPIYQDIGAQQKKADEDYSKAKTDLEEAHKDLAAALPQTGDRKRAQIAIEKAQRALVLAEQKRLYFEIRQKKRMQEDQVSYLKAFKAKKPWPDPDEVRQYQSQRRLEQASRNWDDRVPKSKMVLERRKANGMDDNKHATPAEGEGKGESSGH